MKKIVVVMVFLLSVGSAFAGGKSCDMKHSAKKVALTGKVVSVDGKQFFRVADSDKQYSVCDKSEVKLTKLGADTVKIEGKLVNCSEGEELMIEKASKI